jgi:threonine dehydratase
MNLLQKLSKAYGTPLYNRTQTTPQTEGFTIVSIGENTLEVICEGVTYYVSIKKDSQHKTIEDNFELQEFIAERDATFNFAGVDYDVAQGTLKLFAV